MKKKIKIEMSTRKAANVELSNLCHLSRAEGPDFIEVTEWTNGEGWDVQINTVGDTQTFGITWGQFRAMKKLIKRLDRT